ncbi:hypothetical protein [Micromonospora sp. NPDC002717]|uniref:hypothetical protein n=1 Tax=Micromonospora sp. NPDC002717 TaxID=3154424 RepID=UPI003332157F
MIALIEAHDRDVRRGPSRVDFPPGPDLRLGPVERAKLGARGAVFASNEVSVAFNAFNGALGRRSLIPPQCEGGAHMAKIQAEELLEALSTAIRNKLGAGAALNLAARTADDAKGWYLGDLADTPVRTRC